MKCVWAITKITFLEGVRCRALYGIAVLALMMSGANIFISGMVMREVGKVSVDIGLATTGIAGLLLLLFVSINQLASDLDQKTLYMILARPVSRSLYYVGKYFGMILLISAAMLIFSIAMGCTLLLIKSAAAGYFERVSWFLICVAILLNLAQLILLSAISFFYASFTTSSFLTLILTLMTYIVGHGLPAVKKIILSADLIGVHVSSMTAMIIEISTFLFPNLSLFDIRVQASHGLWPSWLYILGAIAYAILYSMMLMTASVAIFKRREFP